MRCSDGDGSGFLVGGGVATKPQVWCGGGGGLAREECMRVPLVIYEYKNNMNYESVATQCIKLFESQSCIKCLVSTPMSNARVVFRIIDKEHQDTDVLTFSGFYNTRIYYMRWLYSNTKKYTNIRSYSNCPGSQDIR